MGLLSKIFGSQRVKAETLGVLDLTQGAAAPLAERDAAVLGPLFNDVSVSTDQPPKCTWLLVYCTIAEDGRIDGYPHTLREMVRDSGAPFLVVAMSNSPESYTAAASDKPYGKANLVMTLDRKGDAFASFFHRLIVEMKKGKSLPVAWNEIAPQIPGVEHPGPETYAICEFGKLALE